MADISGGDTYFAKTLRKQVWQDFDAELREAAIAEAGLMMDRLSFLRRPDSVNLDNAAYEQAFCLLEQMNAGPSEASVAIARGIKSRSIADASESYTSAAERDKGPGWINGVFYCPKALSWLSSCLGTPVKTGRLVVDSWI